MERCGLIIQPRGHIHTPKSAGECEGMSPRILKYIPTLGIGIPLDFQKFKKWFEGWKLLDWRFPYIVGKFLRHRCLNWTCIIQLNIYDTSCGQKKDQESKCQFDSWPLKIGNRLELRACKRHGTYHWKIFNKGYNFAQDIVSIRGLQKKLWASKVAGISISRFLGP
jgi:hypothetical protein